MRARRFTPSATGGREDTEVWNWTPCSAEVVVLNSANSAPPGLQLVGKIYYKVVQVRL